jgi:hypothetical protein
MALRETKNRAGPACGARGQAAFEYILLLAGIVMFIFLVVVFLREAFLYQLTPRLYASAESAREAAGLGAPQSPIPALPVEDIASRVWSGIMASIGGIGQFAGIIAIVVIIVLLVYYILATRKI